MPRCEYPGSAEVHYREHVSAVSVQGLLAVAGARLFEETHSCKGDDGCLLDVGDERVRNLDCVGTRVKLLQVDLSVGHGLEQNVGERLADEGGDGLALAARGRGGGGGGKSFRPRRRRCHRDAAAVDGERAESAGEAGGGDLGDGDRSSRRDGLGDGLLLDSDGGGGVAHEQGHRGSCIPAAISGSHGVLFVCFFLLPVLDTIDWHVQGRFL